MSHVLFYNETYSLCQKPMFCLIFSKFSKKKETRQKHQIQWGQLSWMVARGKLLYWSDIRSEWLYCEIYIKCPSNMWFGPGSVLRKSLVLVVRSNISYVSFWYIYLYKAYVVCAVSMKLAFLNKYIKYWALKALSYKHIVDLGPFQSWYAYCYKDDLSWKISVWVYRDNTF